MTGWQLDTDQAYAVPLCQHDYGRGVTLPPCAGVLVAQWKSCFKLWERACLQQLLLIL